VSGLDIAVGDHQRTLGPLYAASSIATDLDPFIDQPDTHDRVDIGASSMEENDGWDRTPYPRPHLAPGVTERIRLAAVLGLQ